MCLYKRGTIWWSRITRHGERIDRSTKQKAKVNAQAVEARWLTAINESGVLVPDAVRHDRPVSLLGFKDRFLAYLKNNVPSPNTVQFYEQAYNSLCSPGTELSTSYLSSITPAIIEAWVQRRCKEVSAARVNASLRTLRRALRMAEEWKLIRKCPKIRLLPGERQREFVIKEELLIQMLAHEDCTELLRDLLPLLIDTGLRISEALSLKWEHVGLEPKQGASLGWVYVEKGKSKYAKRYVPLTARAHDVLETIKKASKSLYVFPAENKNHTVSRNWASDQFRVLRDALKLPDDCVVHSCRHTFCTRLGESGCDAFSIMRLAGHSNIQVSQRYVHPTPALLENAIAKMGQTKG